MKKVKALLFAFVLAGMSVVSCSSDDDNGPAATIDGKWNQVKTVISVNNVPTPEIPYDGDEEGCDKDYVEFAGAGVFNDVIYFDPAGIEDCQIDMLDAGTWVKNGTTLTISNDGVLEGVHQIVKLTATELQISMSGQVGGATTTSTIFLKKAN